jgi:hypothetical protein
MHFQASFRCAPNTCSRFAGSRQISKFLTEKQLIMVLRDNPDRDSSRPEMVWWTREEVLLEARNAAALSTSASEPGPENFVKGTTRLRNLQGTLRARDIRRLLIDLHHGDPELLVRKHSILVKLPPLTAIVMHDRCFVFVPDGADSLLGVLLDHICPPSARAQVQVQELVKQVVDEILPFELKAIEAILVTVRAQLLPPL